MAEVVNIGLFGRRNVGKSSIVNMLLGQNFSIVSDTPGTTTDPVKKRIEIFGIGPCRLIDTAGIDDTGELGTMRVSKSMDIVSQIDLALVVIADNILLKEERALIGRLSDMGVPFSIIHNKSDLSPLDRGVAQELSDQYNVEIVEFAAIRGDMKQKESLISMIVKLHSTLSSGVKSVFDGIVSEGERVLLVCPIDAEAPTGRLILPQVQAIRNILDIKATAMIVQPSSLNTLFPSGSNPEKIDIVVTDSQVFREVSAAVPSDVALTSFSMLLARSKGCFAEYIKGTPAIDSLMDGDRVLILESCTHPSSCEDIGRVKLPSLFRKYTGRNLEFEIVAGLDAIPGPIREYSLVVQCGGCMITGRQLYSRLYPAIKAGLPVTNYGMAISYMNGIFDRAVSPLVISE